MTPAEILDFESISDHGVPKDRAIRERFDCSPFVYTAHLFRVVDLPEALLIAPELVARLRRRRERLRALRTPGVSDIPRAHIGQRRLPFDGRSTA
jgi:hypothetical protein